MRKLKPLISLCGCLIYLYPNWSPVCLLLCPGYRNGHGRIWTNKNHNTKAKGGLRPMPLTAESLTEAQQAIGQVLRELRWSWVGVACPPTLRLEWPRMAVPTMLTIGRRSHRGIFRLDKTGDRLISRQGHAELFSDSRGPWPIFCYSGRPDPHAWRQPIPMVERHGT